jgi:3-methyladenine DNA glycosylase AlkD
MTAAPAAAPPRTWATTPARAAVPRSGTEVRARKLGEALAADVHDPATFAANLDAAFRKLADPAYRAGQALIAPGIGPTYGVRTPLQAAVRRSLDRATRRISSSELLLVCDRLLRAPEREMQWFAIAELQRTLPAEPERTWQLLRRAARSADDWITVDNLAHPFGKGILAEPYRWAELEQLTVSPSAWERRLVGSTIATMPFVNRTAGRAPEVIEHAMPLLASLIGDAEPEVQKALAWAYRSMLVVDAEATARALEHEAGIAARDGDGHRAWVVRDTLTKLEPARAAAIRQQLQGVRRRAGSPSTSSAAELAIRFAAMGLGRPMPEPPLA